MGRVIPPVAKEKVLQWFPMAEGSDDVVGYGGGTRKGPTWVEDDKWMGGYALDGDGVDDYVETTDWGEFYGKYLPTGRDFCVAFTLKTEDTDNYFMGVLDDDTSHYLSFGIGRGGSDDDELIVSLRGEDGSGTTQVEKVYFGNDINDGSKKRIIFNRTGTPSDWDAYINGFRAEKSVERTDTISEGDITDPFVTHARYINGEPSDYYEGILDDVIVYGDSLTESEIQQDYLRQHWS